MTFGVLLLAALTALKGICAENPCDLKMSVNITDGAKRDDGSVFHNGVLYSKSLQYEYKDDDGTAHLRGCPCEVKTCIRKCCPLGEAQYDSTCVPTEDPLVHPFNPPVFSGVRNLTNMKANEHFALLFGLKHCSSYVLDPYSQISEAPEEDVFFLQEDGSLYTPYLGAEHPKFIISDDYCMDAWLTPSDNGSYDREEWTTRYLVFRCFDETSRILEAANSIGMCISVPFLIATFFVYAIVPELRNLHGKSLMCYVSGLTVSYIILIFLQLSSRNQMIEEKICTSIAFILYLSFMVSFFWLNVMCFDIWWTFSNMRAHRGSRRASEKRRFMYYSLYAWGLPLLMTCVCALMHFHPGIPDRHVRPQFALNKCWFYDRSGELFYFYIPMMILVLANFVFFGITAYKIIVIKRETAVLQNSDSCRHSQLERDKQRFNLYFKLFLVMGINWLAEWISFMVEGSPYIWTITDFCNSIVGIFIFVLFVCKRKVKNLLLKRYRLLRYGSTVARTRDSSRYRSGSTMSTADPCTEKSFISETNGIKMTPMK